MAKENTLTSKYVEIAAVVAAYWLISISMVFLNKHLLSGKGVNLNAPLFVTFFQCLVTLLIVVVVDLIARSTKRWKTSLPPLVIKPATLRAVLKLSIIFVAMITFNNLCLKYVGVAFYFVGRSLTTVFNVILTYLILGQKTSLSAIACCFVIIFGFFLGVDQEGEGGTLSLVGVLFGVLASLFVSLNSIYIKSVLGAVDNSIWLLTFYNNINACLLLLPLIVVTGEFNVLISYDQLTDLTFWTLMTMSGIFGFAIGYITGMQIKVTSPLTHNISGTAKACAQTLMAVLWFGEIKSALWWFSNALVIFGSAGYTRVKQLEMKHAHEQIVKLNKLDDSNEQLVKVKSQA